MDFILLAMRSCLGVNCGIFVFWWFIWYEYNCKRDGFDPLAISLNVFDNYLDKG